MAKLDRLVCTCGRVVCRFPGAASIDTLNGRVFTLAPGSDVELRCPDCGRTWKLDRAILGALDEARRLAPRDTGALVDGRRRWAKTPA